MARYNNHRVPDSYDPNWKKYDLGEYWDWWHLGYEDGVSDIKFEYGLDEQEGAQIRIEKLEQENRQLKALLGANVRVIKEELRKETLDTK